MKDDKNWCGEVDYDQQKDQYRKCIRQRGHDDRHGHVYSAWKERVK